MTEDPTEAALAARYRPRLAAERDALLASSSGTRADRKPVELDQQMVGRLSRMDAMQSQAMAEAIEARRHGRIRAIAAALSRLDAGDYGWCEDCGEFIGFGRLDANPTVMRCVGCAG